MNAPTAINIRTWSQLDFSLYGFGEDADLQRLVNRVASWLEQEVGRTFADTDETAFPGPQMQEIAQLASEWKAMRSHPDFTESVIDFDTVQNYTTSNYSEARRGPHAFVGRHPHPEIAGLLADVAAAGSPAYVGTEAPQVGSVEPDWEIGREILDAKTNGIDTRDMRSTVRWTGGAID